MRLIEGIIGPFRRGDSGNGIMEPTGKLGAMAESKVSELEGLDDARQIKFQNESRTQGAADNSARDSLRQREYSSGAFSDVLSGALDIASSVLAPGLGTIDNFSGLMQQQMLWQIEMQFYTAESNISKSKHEVAMAPIRNLRVG